MYLCSVVKIKTIVMLFIREYFVNAQNVLLKVKYPFKSKCLTDVFKNDSFNIFRLHGKNVRSVLKIRKITHAIFMCPVLGDGFHITSKSPEP